MLKAFKYRIYPSDSQKEQLAQAFGCVRLVYNLALETKNTAYASNGTNLSQYDLIKQLPELKSEFDFLKQVPSQSLQQSIIHLDTAYKRFFKGAGFPKFKNRYSKQSIKFPQGCKVNIEEGTISVPKYKSIPCVFHREFYGTMKTVTLTKTVTDKYFVSILVETGTDLPKTKRPIKKSTSVGVDLGIKEFLVTSDQEVVVNQNFLKTQLKKLRREQRKLARCVKDSNNRLKQKKKVALVHEKVRNQRADFLHKLSTDLVKRYDTIILEDLAVSNMIKNRCLSRAIADVGWNQFKTYISYKSEWYGKNMITIGRFEPSSKLCSNCGNHKSDLKLSDRTYNCGKCKFSIDRDYNAALNIKNFGLRTQPSNVNVVH